MITKSSPIKHRIIVEKISADGSRELIGDSGFKSEYDKDKILLLLEMMNLDLQRKKMIYNILKKGEKIKKK